MPKDTLGVEIRVGDTVRVIGYGYGIRLTDTGLTTKVTGFTHKGNVVHDGAPRDGKPLNTACLAVLRRDGYMGLEGNRDEADRKARKQAVIEAAERYGYKWHHFDLTVIDPACGAVWWLHDFNERHTRLVLNGMRLHYQGRCPKR